LTGGWHILLRVPHPLLIWQRVRVLRTLIRAEESEVKTRTFREPNDTATENSKAVRLGAEGSATRLGHPAYGIEN